MTTAFDPYLQWLGIRDPQRPPNHYRLLGLELFENDASVIAMSADRQMAHLRNFKTGPEADVAERLLNELSTARICLLKADRKVAYDNQLRASLQTKPSPTAKPVVTAAPAPISVANRAAAAPMKQATTAAWKPWAALAGLVSLTVGLTVLLIQKNSPSGNEQVAVKEEGEGQKAPPKNNPKPQPAVKPAEVNPLTANPGSKSNESINTKTDPNKQPPAGERENTTPIKSLPKNADGKISNEPDKEQSTSTNKNVESMTDPQLLLGEAYENTPPEKSSLDKDPKEEPTKNPETEVVAQSPPAEPAKPSRLAVPDKAAIAAKTKEIREIFDEEYKSQKPEVKAALATKLLQSSMDSKDDTVMRYVLLNEARANAILGGTVKVSVEVTEELVRDYEVSDGEERFTLFSKLLAGANRNLAYSQLVLEELRKSIGMLQESDDYDVALKLVNIALAAARNMRDPGLVTEMTQRAKELNLQKQSFQKAKIAKDNLVKSPADPVANEQWGSYLSFTKGEFNAGLPFLARGSSAELAELARRELANNQAPSDQLKLADDWWGYGEKLQAQDTTRAVNIWQHAGQKYVSLFPKLAGIDKAKAEKRINELQKINDQKNLRDQQQIVKLLTQKPWNLYWDKTPTPDKMIFRPDGTLGHTIFEVWGFEGNELQVKGQKRGDTYHHIGKIKFNLIKFDLEFYQGGRLVNHGSATPVE